MTKDRYPDLGPKLPVRDYDHALELVQQHWPRAWQEGSTGVERTFWIRPAPELLAGLAVTPEPELVGHFFPGREPTPRNHCKYWVRILIRR